jgi:hypothetical protein
MRADSDTLNKLIDGMYLIGGAYVVNPYTANDIAVFVHQLQYTDKLLARLDNYKFARLQQGDKKYDEMDGEPIISVYEGRINSSWQVGVSTKYNIIIVGTHYWPAYVGAIRRMILSPEEYGTREARVELHRNLCKQIKEIL